MAYSLLFFSKNVPVIIIINEMVTDSNLNTWNLLETVVVIFDVKQVH
jgi:hypothetical protein